MNGGIDYNQIQRRIRACDYLSVAQLFLQDNFLLSRPLKPEDIKPRLLGHWGTCPGINIAYANFRAYATALASRYHSSLTNFHFILGPGHGFPALQANLFYDGDLQKVDPHATRDEAGIKYLCKNFSWPGGFPSHASPLTPGVICEGGELGYALGAAYGLALGHPEKTIAVLLGDGELETASALASLNLVKLAGNTNHHGRVLPILHLNGYKISGPTIYGRKSERELNEFIRGFGYTPLWIASDTPECFQNALKLSEATPHPFFVLKTEKGLTGPQELHGKKVAGNFRAHQIPLPDAKTDEGELKELSRWLKSYEFNELFDPETGFKDLQAPEKAPNPLSRLQAELKKSIPKEDPLLAKKKELNL